MKSYFVCQCCEWEGFEPKIVIIPNPVNEDDLTLYEEIVCPECGENRLWEGSGDE